MTNLLKFRQDVVESPIQMPTLLRSVDEMIAVPSAAKKLMRPFREYQKARLMTGPSTLRCNN